MRLTVKTAIRKHTFKEIATAIQLITVHKILTNLITVIAHVTATASYVTVPAGNLT